MDAEEKLKFAFIPSIRMILSAPSGSNCDPLRNAMGFRLETHILGLHVRMTPYPSLTLPPLIPDPLTTLPGNGPVIGGCLSDSSSFSQCVL